MSMESANMVKERPILFSAEMVRAILEGRKTQTRRVVKLEHSHGCFTSDCPHWQQSECDKALAEYARTECPYGVPGDRLWVRETWGHRGSTIVCSEDFWTVDIQYCADKNMRKLKVPCDVWRAWKSQRDRRQGEDADHYEYYQNRSFHDWRPSIFMPRWASRITLKITDVRVQRIQDISAADCFAEGIVQTNPEIPKDPQIDFRALWDSINAKKYPWSSNPWVRALTFRRVSK